MIRTCLTLMLMLLQITCALAATAKSCPPVTNPLNPLTAAEIAATTALVRNASSFPRGALFVSVILKEPPKIDVLNWQGGPFERTAEVLLYVNATNQTYRVLVDVCSYTVLSFTNISPDIPPMDSTNPPDLLWWPSEEIMKVVAQNAKCVTAFAKRGITRKQLLNGTVAPLLSPFEALVEKNRCTGCCPEMLSPSTPPARYFVATFTLPAVDFLAMIDGLLVVFDVTHKKIVKVIDEFVVPLPKLVPDPINPVTHPPLKPLCATMPEGPSFTLADNQITWDNWKIRLSWHPRTGVQLYQISYNDHGKDRSVLYKASVSEALVHYNTQRPIFFRNFPSIDSFGYPLLSRLIPLERGKDVPAYATLLNIPDVNTDGTVRMLTNALGIYEQDGDLLYRAPNVTGADGARGRQLCIRSMFSGVIYVWVFTWIFNQDGTIQPKVDVFGRDLYAIAQKSNQFGSRISRNNYAPNHTHTYVFRLDFDVNGLGNTVIEENSFEIDTCTNCTVKPCCSAKLCRPCAQGTQVPNRCGQAIQVTQTELARELDAARTLNFSTNRSWKIINPNKTNRLGNPVGYALVPFANQKALATDWSWVKTHLAFLKKQVFVTRYNADEQFGAGNFPLQKPDDVGLGQYIKNNQELLNKDIVFWYTINFFHTPHSEDYPFVTGLSQSFLVAPENFFNFNPAVTVPNPCNCKSADTVCS